MTNHEAVHALSEISKNLKLDAVKNMGGTVPETFREGHPNFDRLKRYTEALEFAASALLSKEDSE